MHLKRKWDWDFVPNLSLSNSERVVVWGEGTGELEMVETHHLGEGGIIETDNSIRKMLLWSPWGSLLLSEFSTMFIFKKVCLLSKGNRL